MRSIDGRGQVGFNYARWVRALLAGTAISAAATLPAAAGDATWTGVVSGDFNTAGNWAPAGQPNGIATFGAAPIIALTFSADATFGGWTFNAAPPYTFTNTIHNLDFTGAGI